ncbi:EcsC family protein [Paenibacillus oleatilyticus]|uniref:EcsC family protein n=1 Tax=Paenibacillus oleatilyticus TaxID=2594886 RepID=UPI001C1F74E4|nr:EcsC family protein [Paenibacillus oleatilyticus]MBU7320870.1 EcsC family protein [Paenibacillus oleatilyticus]
MTINDNAHPLPAPDTKEELRQALLDIEAWEASQKDLWFWEKLGRLPFQLLDRLTPKALQNKLAQAIDEVGSFVQTGGQYLISEKSVLDQLNRQLASRPDAPAFADALTLGEVSSLPLAVMDGAADEFARSRTLFATAQGATTGFGGIFTLAIDIPAILGLSLKVLQEMAMVYGYDPNDKRERVFVIKCLQFASSDIVGKKAVLEELADFDNEHRQRDAISQLQGWREVVTIYRDNFGWKKLFQLVPVAGMIFGAVLNRSTLQDVAEAGKMLYRKRRVLERLRNG